MQVQDSPRSSRVRQAAQRASRSVRLNDGNNSWVQNENYSHSASRGIISSVVQSVIAEPDERSLDEFDQDFIDAAREAFGEGFIPASQLPTDLGDRVRHIVSVSHPYVKDFIFDQLERMLVAKVPVDTIAARFRVSVMTIYGWRRQLAKRWGDRARGLRNDDIAVIIGEQLSHFELRMAMGMQLAQKANATLNEIRTGLDIAERAHVNMLKYHDILGFYDSKPLSKPKGDVNHDDEHVKKARSMTDMMRTLLGEAVDNPVGGDAVGDEIEDGYATQVG